jgi:hypothetical protein
LDNSELGGIDRDGAKDIDGVKNDFKSSSNASLGSIVGE